MINAHRRIALLTGVAASTLGLAAPALAAVTTSAGIQHIVGPGGTATDTLTICDVDDSCFFGVEASGSQVAFASVTSIAHGQIIQVGIGTDVELVMVNLADANVGAHATAAAPGGNAIAHAVVHTGILQIASAEAAPGGGSTIFLVDPEVIAKGSFTNSGNLLIDAVATAAAAGTASALAIIDVGFEQHMIAADQASASYSNTGSVALSAIAHATADDFAIAVAAVESGQYQIVTGGEASARFGNSGTLSINAVASADGHVASANAFAEYLVEQDVTAGASSSAALASAEAIATATISNSGTATLAASATAFASSGPANATAVANEAFVQEVESEGSAIASLVNSGSLKLSANAVATGQDALAHASIIQPISQAIEGATGAANFTNAATMTFNAVAHASAATFASAGAVIGAIELDVDATDGVASFVNSGTFSAKATATAQAGSTAIATAFATGLHQTVHGGRAVVDNQGLFSVSARAATQAADAGTATAVAFGYVATGAEGLAVDASNDGTLDVSAVAEAHDEAFASAIGIHALLTSGTASDEARLSGTLTNSGTINVVARVSGGGFFSTAAPGGGTSTVALSSAVASGILLQSGVNTLTVTNSGAINVDAIAESGGRATATAIRVATTGRLPGDANDVFTFTNDGGTIRARTSFDGGQTWHRGTAIDVSRARNRSVINLLGDASIYGHIAVQEGDAINVASGTLYFDGIINPTYLGTNDGVGTLTVDHGGNLILAGARFTGDPRTFDGVASASVNTFTVTADGTITYELQPTDPGSQPPGSYQQVYADVANIDGAKLVATIATSNGLFEDSYVWDNVIDANTLNGKFASCSLTGPYSDSLLVGALQCSYDANNNVDLSLSRVGFDSVGGLNQNGAAVGSGLEGVYRSVLGGAGGLAGTAQLSNASATPGIVDLLADLFLFTDASNYNVALNQLSGSVYANYLQSFPSIGVHYNDLLDGATSCEAVAGSGSVRDCRTNPIRVWGQTDYQSRRADGDVEAGSTKAKRFTGLLGIDTTVGDAAIVGVSAGYVTNHARDNQFGDSANAEGAQIGAYAAYDKGPFTLKGVTTYSWFNGDSTRHVDFRGLAPGATFSGTPTGKPDVNLLTLGLHGAARLPIGGRSAVTPYLNLDYVHAKLQGFVERGLDGADLTVEGGSSNHSFATTGVKFATQAGGVISEIDLGYRHRFGSARSRFSAAFLGDTSSAFDIISAAQKRGTFVAGVSVGGKVGTVDVRIGYNGEYNGDVTSHGGNFKVSLPLGGH